MSIKEDENLRNKAEMACLYAPPEVMSERSKSIDSKQTYPYRYAVQADSENDPLMNTLYSSPRIIPMDEKSCDTLETQTKSDKARFCGCCGERIVSSACFCDSCENAIQLIDREVTVQFCKKCGRENRMDSRFCVICGNEMRPIRSHGEPNTPVSHVCASPENKPVTDKNKVGLFQRLFGRKNK